MSRLILVRHAQASFFAADYDRLSPLGEAQARRLGEHWARTGARFSEVYVGPRLRQRRTAEVVGAEYRRAGIAWPEPVVVEDLDEYDLTGLLEKAAPGLARVDSAFEQLAAVYRRSQEDERARAFQRMFERLLIHWQTELLARDTEGLENWLSFRDRVARALDGITRQEGRGRSVAAFTSGGFIGTAVARALGAPDRAALELSWRLRNASLTQLIFTAGRLTLDEFNSVPHLPDTAEQTYR